MPLHASSQVSGLATCRVQAGAVRKAFIDRQTDRISHICFILRAGCYHLSKVASWLLAGCKRAEGSQCTADLGPCMQRQLFWPPPA